MADYTNIYEAIINNTDSVLIIFLIVLTLAVVIAFIPLYSKVLKGRKADREHEIEVKKSEGERESRIIKVISDNSAVIAELNVVTASLKTTLDANGLSFTKAIERVHSRLDEQGMTIAKTHQNVANILDNQREIASKLNKVFVTASGGKMPPEEKGGGE